MLKEIKFKGVNIWDYAKLNAIVTAVMGMFIALFYACFGVLFSMSAVSIPGASGEPALVSAAGAGIVAVICMIILIPLFFAIIGYIEGLISAYVINWAVNKMSGVRLHIEE